MFSNESKTGLRRILKTGVLLYSSLALFSCGGDDGTEPDLFPQATTEIIYPFFGMSPLAVQARYECSDDKGIREYKISKGGRETSNGKKEVKIKKKGEKKNERLRDIATSWSRL